MDRSHNSFALCIMVPVLASKRLVYFKLLQALHDCTPRRQGEIRRKRNSKKGFVVSRWL